MKKKRLHRMNSASSSNAYIKSSSRQRSANLRKFKLSSEISITLIPSQSGAVYEHIGGFCLLIIFSFYDPHRRILYIFLSCNPYSFIHIFVPSMGV